MKLSQLVKIGLTLCCLLVLVVHIRNGYYSRMTADDWCSAAVANEQGVLSAMHYWYVSWSGRYSANFLDALAGLASPGITAYSTPLALAAWVATIFYALRKERVGRIDAIFLATFLISAVSISIPSVGQSLYWGQGMRALIPSLILMPLVFATRNPFFAATLAFIAGGFGETYAVIQFSLLVVVIALCRTERRFWGAMAGAVLALLVVVAAPGNAVRRSYFLPSPGLVDLTRISVISLVDFLTYTVTAYWPVLLALPAAALLTPPFFQTSKSANRWIAVGTPVVLLLLLLGCFVPAVYAKSETLPFRTWIIPQFLLIVGLLIWFRSLWSLVDIPMPDVFATLLPAALLAVILLNGAWMARYELVELKPFAKKWETNHATILQARVSGETAVSVPYLRNPIITEEFQWVEDCMSDYYDIKVTRIR